MTARTAIRHPHRPLPGFSYRTHDLRKGRAAALLPFAFVARVSAAIFAMAAFGLIWTVTMHHDSVVAEIDAPVVTGTVKAN